MPSLGAMAKAVEDLVYLKRDHLRGFEKASYDRGISPGPDMAFAGVRILIMEGEAAAKLLRRLATHELALEKWLDALAGPGPAEIAAEPVAAANGSA